jgi:8-oxo-dGTP pyrophosphatase MutT (NUDIX family)
MTPRTPETPQKPAAPRPIRAAATLIVLRDAGRGLEVLMLRRAEKANDQNSGASVFPGGVIDAHDRSLHGQCSGVDDVAASARLAVPEGGLDYYAAAIRECFEEAGLLFATDASGDLVKLDGLPPEQLATMRDAAVQGTDALLALCAEHGWQLAADRLTYFTHWLTPPGMPRRFDTRFFIAPMPEGQSVRPDGSETVEHTWLKPAEAVDPARGLKLMNVTRRILQQLAQFDSADHVIAHARALRHIPRVMPRLATGPAGLRPVNMEEPAYEEVGLVDPDGAGHGRYVHEAGLVMRLSARTVRVTDGTELAHSYFVGAAGGDCALIDPLSADAAHVEALRAAAPGRVRWILWTRAQAGAPANARDALMAAWPEASVEQPAPGDELIIGDARLQVLSSAGDTQARQFLLVEEHTLFTGAAQPPMIADADLVQWIAPGQGFMRRALHGV